MTSTDCICTRTSPHLLCLPRAATRSHAARHEQARFLGRPSATLARAPPDAEPAGAREARAGSGLCRVGVDLPGPPRGRREHAAPPVGRGAVRHRGGDPVRCRRLARCAPTEPTPVGRGAPRRRPAVPRGQRPDVGRRAGGVLRVCRGGVRDGPAVDHGDRPPRGRPPRWTRHGGPRPGADGGRAHGGPRARGRVGLGLARTREPDRLGARLARDATRRSSEGGHGCRHADARGRCREPLRRRRARRALHRDARRAGGAGARLPDRVRLDRGVHGVRVPSPDDDSCGRDQLRVREPRHRGGARRRGPGRAASTMDRHRRRHRRVLGRAGGARLAERPGGARRSAVL